MKSASLNSNRPIRMILAATAVSPFLFVAACSLRGVDTNADGGGPTSASVAPAITAAPAATDTTAATVAAVATTGPVATVAPPGAKHTGKTVKLPNGQTGAVVALTDGGTAVVPQSADGGVPGLAGFSIPTAFPSGVTMPTAIPTTLPSGFPTTLPSGFKMPTFPTATANH
jgi:hypothetical protein